MKVPAILFLFAATACAQSMWQLTTSDLQTQNIRVQKMDASGLTYLDNAGHAAHLPINQLVSLAQSAASHIDDDNFTLILTDGERWTGNANALSGDQLSWQSPLLGEMKIPVQQVLGINHVNAVLPPAPNSTQDIAQLANGDAVSGAISAITSTQVILQSATGPISVPWTTIRQIHFASLGAGSTNIPPEHWQLHLDDGTSIKASSITLSDDQLTVQLSSGNHALNTSHVIAIEQLDGSVIFLTTLPPAEDVQTPLLGAPWPAQMNMDFNGDPLPHAISVRAYSRLSWAIPRGIKSLHVQYRIPGELALADLNVRVQLDGKIAYQQQHVHANTISPPIDLPLGDAKHVELEVDSADAYRAQSWLVWISPALLR